MNYDVGIAFSEQYVSRPLFDAGVVRRELEIIKNDLYCNAIRISGTDIDRLIAATQDALEQGFEVWLSPHLHDKTEQETLEYTRTCAAAAEMLRVRWPGLVFILGCELTFFMQGILKGANFMERLGNPLALLKLKVLGAHNRPLNAFLAKANAAVREVFGGRVTYASAPIEAVDWRLFDFVCLDYYRGARNRDSYGERLKRHFAHGKPVIITEVGCCAYQGAEDEGARGFMIVDGAKTPMQLRGDYVRDEGLQARELTDMLRILDGAGVDGAFVFTFVSPALTYSDNPRYDLDMASYSVAKSYADKYGATYTDMLWEPKESFRAVADFFARQGA